MLKLKHLFDERLLAFDILSDWENDYKSPDEMNSFRISANAVYQFTQNGQSCYLRFAPVLEKQSKNVEAELDFLNYLKDNGYLTPEILPPKQGHEIVVKETAFGEYTASAFKGVPGKRLDRIAYSDNIYSGFGKELGRLHSLSKDYRPRVSRGDWFERLNWTAEALKEYAAPDEALREVSILGEFFQKLPVTPYNYGLIHYDFEPDNIFYDEATGIYSVIDFDEAVYHWYVMDIERSVDSIKSELEEEHHERAASNFIAGYRSVFEVGQDMLSLMPVFKRYADIYSYGRCLRAVYEKLDNEPDWMVDLRKKLNNSMEAKRKFFGNEIDRRFYEEI